MVPLPEQAPPPAPDPSAGAPPAVPRRRRRVLRWLLLALLLLAAAVAGAGSWYLQPRRLGRLLSEQLGAALGTRVSLEIQRRGLGHWELRRVALGGDSLGPPDLELERLGLYARPTFLLERRLRLDSLVVQGLRLNLRWRDSLLVPSWLDLSDTTQSADTSSFDHARWLNLLADHNWRLDSTRVVLRDLRLSLRGSQQGVPLEILGPPLGLDLRAPRLGPAELRALARDQLPAGLLGGLRAGWSGPWSDRAPGAPLRPLPLPPGLRAALALSGVELARRPLLVQDLDFNLGLARDTLRATARLAAKPAQLDLRYERAGLPLPDSLALELALSWPTRALPLRAGLELQLALAGAGLESSATCRGDLRQRPGGWQAGLSWRQELTLRLEELGALPALGAPALRGVVHANLEATAGLELDSTFTTGRGSSRERLELESPLLGLPDYALELEGLRLSQSLEAELDLAQVVPLAPRLELRAALARLGLGTPPLDDPRRLDLRLSLRGGGPRDSLRLAADLGVASWFGGRVDLSAGGRLPGPQEWLEDYETWLERPQQVQRLPLWADIETSALVLDGLDPSLRGGLRASAHLETGQGLRFEGEAVPDAMRLSAAGQELELPLHRLRFEGGALLGDLYAAIPWPDTLWAELGPDPLPALRTQLGHRDGQVRVVADWPQLDLPFLLALLPPAWQPAGVAVAAGRAGLRADLRLDEAGLPLGGQAALELAGGALAASGYRLEGLEARLELGLDTLGADYALDLRAAAVVQEDPVWSWEGLSLAGSGRLELPFALLLNDSLWLEPGRGGPQGADGRFTLALESLELEGTLAARAADWRGALPDLAELELRMGRGGRLRPWPGLRLTGTAGVTQRIERLEGARFLAQGRVAARIDTLDWYQDAHVEQLLLDLPLRQELTVLPEVAVPVDGRRQPVDWNTLRGWDRWQPVFAAAGRPRDPREGRGWPLRMALARYGAWSAEALAADLRVGQGRLDLPEFRCALFGGGVRGALSVVGVDTMRYALDCSLIGLDSRYFEFGDRAKGGASKARGLVNAVMHVEGEGLDLGALDQLRGQLRMPELDRQVTLNLLRALDAQGVDPSIGKVRKLLELPGFKYRVEAVDFDVAHGFARPKVALRKSPFSPLPDVSIPMSPLPLGFMVRNFALAEEEAP